MNGNTRKIALTTIAFAATVALAAACSSKKSGGTPADTIVLRGNGSAADFSCNHSFTDPASTATTVGAKIHTVSQQVNGTTPDLPGTHVANVSSIATLATSGTAVTSDGTGIAVLPEPDNTRYSIYTHQDTGYVDTYGFNFLAPAVGNTNGTVDARVIPTTIYAAFIGLLLPASTDLSNTFQFAGAVGDCTDQGAQIANATVMIPGGHLCSESTTLPCIAYIKDGVPNIGAKSTDSDGAFIVAGLTANTAVTVQVFGVTTAGAAAEQIGAIQVNGKDGTISLGATTPLTN